LHGEGLSVGFIEISSIEKINRAKNTLILFLSFVWLVIKSHCIYIFNNFNAGILNSRHF